MSEKESVKFRGQSGHAAHDQPFSEVTGFGYPSGLQDKTRTRVFQHCERVGVWHAKPKAHVWQGDLLLRLVRMLFHRDNHVFFTGFGRRLQAIRLGSSQNLFQIVR